MERSQITHAVVEFTDDKSVAVVPVCWLSAGNTICYWPPYSTQEVMDKAVKYSEKPKENWAKYSARVLFLSSTYELARTTLPAAEQTSDLENRFTKRQQRPVKRLISDTDTDTESESTVQRQPEVSVEKHQSARQNADKQAKATEKGGNEQQFLQPSPLPPADKRPDARYLTPAPEAASFDDENDSIASAGINRIPANSLPDETLDSSNNTCGVSEGIDRLADVRCTASTPATPRSSFTNVSSQPREGCSNRISTSVAVEDNCRHNGTYDATPRTSHVHPRSQASGHPTSNRKTDDSNGYVNSNALRTILTLLTELKSSVADLQVQVTNNTRVLQSLSSSAVAELPDDLDIELPFDSRQALESVEAELAQNRTLFRSLVVLLASKGGNDLKDVTKRIMSTLITNQLMKDLNWTGQGNKVAFGKLLLVKVISKAVRRNVTLGNVTDADIQRQIVRCLHGAPDRDGGRSARMKRTATTAAMTVARSRPIDIPPAVDTDSE